MGKSLVPGRTVYVRAKEEARRMAIHASSPDHKWIEHSAHDAGDLPHFHSVNQAGQNWLTIYYGSCGPKSKATRESADAYFLQFDGEEEGEAGRSRIEDRTHTPGARQTRREKGYPRPRPKSSVYALVLHQMACCRNRKEGGYDKIGAHYSILADGRILQTQPIEALMYASNGFNKHSVAVEFAGNFPSIKGKCWQPKCTKLPCPDHGCHQLTQAQIDAGRYLVEHLLREPGMKLTHILAHRQSSGTRANDPGPDIWYHVGQWAIDKYGLKDGGASFKVGTGQPIPPEWRDWGRRARLASRPATGGREALAVRQAIARGQRDENQLTNMVFFGRHPERGGRKLVKSEPRFKQLASEWLAIRDGLVRPTLRTGG